MRWLALWSLWLCAPSVAWAHGNAPVPSGVASAGANWAVVTPYGLLRSTDDGATWGWLCEEVIGLGARHDPSVLMMPSGGLLLGTGAGLATSNDGGCTWQKPTATWGTGDVGGLTRATDGRLWAWQANAAGDETRLIVSLDEGAHWSPQGPLLPLHTLALSLRAAPNSPQRLYATVLDGPLAAEAALLVSDDGGEHWTRRDLPADLVTRVAAVAPGNADTLYLRVTSGGAGELWRSLDAGKTWQTVWATTAPLSDVLLSEDGQHLWVGVDAPSPGLYVAHTDNLQFEQRATLRATCLGWHAGELVACTDESVAGFSIGRSVNGGATWTPVLKRTTVQPQTCAAGTPAAKLCPQAWPLTAAALGIASTPETAAEPAVTTCAVSRSAANPLAIAGLLVAVAAVGWRRYRTS